MKSHHAKRFCGNRSAALLEGLENRTLLTLLGVPLEFPLTTYDSSGVVSYNAASQSLQADATPLQFKLGITSVARNIQDVRDFSINILVSNTGTLVGGADGDDLRIEGRIDVDGNGTIDYDGVLLTGEIIAFGYAESGATDRYDFRFTPTGGDLLSYFAGTDIGVTMTSEHSSFANSFAVNFTGGAKGNVGPIAPAVPGLLAGRVYEDLDGNGFDNNEPGINGVTIYLTGTQSNGTPVSLSTVTSTIDGIDGSYLFENLAAGTYRISETQPAVWIDGQESVGSLGGVVGNDVFSNVAITTVARHGRGYNFGEITPPTSSLSGLVYEDFNNDGEINFGELAIPGATVTLSGTDFRGNAVSLSQVTDADGAYIFLDLAAGSYTITETQPAGFVDGLDTLGTLGGTATNDQFAVTLAAGTDGFNYNYGERPSSTGTVHAGQTATIGFWNNKNGQKLLTSLNGSATSTQLGDWLAATLPNIFGANAGSNDLTGKTNAQVAAFYQTKFKVKGQKLDAQVLGVAFAVYATNSTLAGTVAAGYGFTVTSTGVGTATYNVGLSGAAFGVANGTTLTVMDILLATNAMSNNGSGILYSGDQVLRNLANTVYTGINESGDIA